MKLPHLSYHRKLKSHEHIEKFNLVKLLLKVNFLKDVFRLLFYVFSDDIRNIGRPFKIYNAKKVYWTLESVAKHP